MVAPERVDQSLRSAEISSEPFLKFLSLVVETTTFDMVIFPTRNVLIEFGFCQFVGQRV